MYYDEDFGFDCVPYSEEEENDFDYEPDFDNPDYVIDAYMHHHDIEEYERRYEEKEWEKMLSREKENDDNYCQEDDCDIETYESEIAIEPPPINKATFYSQDELFMNETGERRDLSVQESKLTLSDSVILREFEATRAYVDEKVCGLEEVNKLWFHTLSDQIQAIKRNATTSNKGKPSDSVSSGQALNSIVLGDILNNQDTIINNTSSAKIKTAEQMERAIDVIAESLSAIVSAQGQTARDLKSLKDTKYQQANDIDSLIIKLTRELESVNRLKSEIHSLRVLYFLTIAIFIIIIIILAI